MSNQLPAIYGDIAAERQKQQQQWGTQRHGFVVWQTVLTEEVGELAECVLDHRKAAFDPASHDRLIDRLQEMRQEAVQVAAVAVSMIEHIDEDIQIRRSARG